MGQVLTGLVGSIRFPFLPQGIDHLEEVACGVEFGHVGMMVMVQAQAPVISAQPRILFHLRLLLRGPDRRGAQIAEIGRASCRERV